MCIRDRYQRTRKNRLTGEQNKERSYTINKVLIIDDDKELCVLIKRSVLSEDIEADFCNTGKEMCIRDRPWLLLQYGNSDVESIGADRVESLLSTSPDENNGQDREEIVVEEIEDRENTNLTITKTINRLGTVFFLFIFNIGI